MPFKSKAQQRWMYANKPDMAKKWSDHTSDHKSLPEKSKKKKKEQEKKAAEPNVSYEDWMDSKYKPIDWVEKYAGWSWFPGFDWEPMYEEQRKRTRVVRDSRRKLQGEYWDMEDELRELQNTALGPSDVQEAVRRSSNQYKSKINTLQEALTEQYKTESNLRSTQSSLGGWIDNPRLWAGVAAGAGIPLGAYGIYRWLKKRKKKQEGKTAVAELGKQAAVLILHKVSLGD